MRRDPITEFLAQTPKRVLMTADTVGGVWTYAIQLARALGDHDIEVALATMGAPLTTAQWREAEKAANLGIFESEYRLEWMPAPWDDVRRAGEWLLELEQQLRPDVVHLNGYAHGALPFQAPKVVVAHSCVLSWWDAVKGEEAPASWNTYRQAVREGLVNAQRIVAPSRAQAREVQRWYGPLPHADVIYNGRQLPLAQARFKEPLIFSAGRVWDEAKNISLLAMAAQGLPWKAFVAGDTTAPDGASHCLPHLTCLGKLNAEEMAHWMARAAIYAMPAKYEPFGLSILEAALSGCALVLGDIASLREIWGDAARYVDPNDPNALNATLKELINSEDLRRDLGQRARERALSFTPNTMAAAYLALYSELIKGEQPAPELVCVS